jgi:AcrR family transcriptional regulator
MTAAAGVGKRERTKAANREAILVAARRVFSDIGYGAASVRDVVRETDLATGTFYNYFPDKESVLRALVDEITVEARARVRTARAAATTLEEFVSRGFRAYFEFLAEDPDTVALMRRNSGTIRTMFNEPALGAGIEELRADLEAAVAQGRIPPHDADLMAVAMVGAGVEIACTWSSATRPTSSARSASSRTCSWVRLNASGSRGSRAACATWAWLACCEPLMPTKANFPSMRRLVIPIAALIALLAIPAGANAYTLGVSDQQASTFTNPLFAPLKFKAARYIAPYDVMESTSDKAQWDAWYSAATAAHQKVLISFEHSHRSNSRALKAPTTAAYTKELKKFKAAYPKVREISPWNEVNRCHRTIGGSVQGQPTKICSLTSGPKQTAAYYMAARKVFSGSKYTIVGLDILDEQNVNKTVKYLQSFLRHASPDPEGHRLPQLLRHEPLLDHPHQARAGRLPRQGVADRDRRHRQAGHVVPGQHEPRGEGAGVHVHAGQDELAASSGSSSTSSTRRPIRRPRLRRGPHQPGRHAAPGLRRRQEPQGAQLPQVGH